MLQTEDIEHCLRDQGYTPLECVGKGGFGYVYRCRSTGTSDDHEEVAIKVLDKQRMNRAGMKKRVIQEVEVHSSVSHSGVVRFYNAWEDNKAVYLMMEYCAMGDLYTWTRNHGPFDDASCQSIMKQVIGAIEHLHGKKIIHRDLKLSNLLLRRAPVPESLEGSIALCDFGLAVKFEAEEGERNTLCGTPVYIAPEIVQNRPHSYKADMWGCGCLLYMLKFGKSPISNKGKSTAARNLSRRGHITSRDEDSSENAIRFARSFRANIDNPETCSASLRDLILGLLQLDPSKRLGASDALRHSYLKHAIVSTQSKTDDDDDASIANPRRNDSLNCSNPCENTFQFDIPKALSVSSESNNEPERPPPTTGNHDIPKALSVSSESNNESERPPRRTGTHDIPKATSIQSNNEPERPLLRKGNHDVSKAVSSESKKLLAQAYSSVYFEGTKSYSKEENKQLPSDLTFRSGASHSAILEPVRTDYLPTFSHITLRALVSVNSAISGKNTQRDPSISIDSFFFSGSVRLTVYENFGLTCVSVQLIVLEDLKRSKMDKLLSEVKSSKEATSRDELWDQFYDLLMPALDDSSADIKSFALEQLPEEWRSHYMYLHNSVKVLSLGYPTIKLFSPQCLTTLMANFPQPDCQIRFSKRIEAVYSMRYSYCILHFRNVGSLVLWISPKPVHLSNCRLQLNELDTSGNNQGIYLQVKDDGKRKTSLFDFQSVRKWLLSAFYFVRHPSTDRQLPQGYELIPLPQSMNCITSLVAFIQEKTNKCLTYLEKLHSLYESQWGQNPQQKRYSCIRENRDCVLPNQVHRALEIMDKLMSEGGVTFSSTKDEPETTKKLSTSGCIPATTAVTSAANPSLVPSSICTSVIKEQLNFDNDILKVGRTKSGKLCIVFTDKSRIVINKRRETVQFLKKPESSNCNDSTTYTNSESFVSNSSPPRSVGPDTAYLVEEYSFSRGNSFGNTDKGKRHDFIPPHVQRRLQAARAYMKTSKRRQSSQLLQT